MRKLIIVCGVAFFSFLACVRADLSNGLVASYALDGNAQDQSGNGYNGTPANVEWTTNRFGQPNSACHFNGRNSSIRFSSVPLKESDNWTICAWVRPASLYQVGGIVEMGYDNGVFGDGYGIMISRFDGWDHPGNELLGIYSGVAYIDSGCALDSTQQWFHVAMVRNSGTASFYVNGVQTSQTESAYYPESPTSFHIGSQNGVRFFNGDIDDVRIYNRVLSANEIASFVEPKGPSIAIESPRTNERTAVVTLRVNVASEIPIARVSYWFTNYSGSKVTASLPAEATLNGGAGKVTSWISNPEPLPGTNVVVAQVVDLAGRVKEVHHKFFYIVPTPFTVAQIGDGNGRIVGRASAGGNAVPALGTRELNIGEGYSLTAEADASSVFLGWSGSLGSSTNRTLRFIMEPGLSAQARFATNPLARVAGTYNGLFYETNQTRIESAGMLKGFTVTKMGDFSGKICLDGTNYRIAGNFDSEGASHTTILSNEQMIVSMDLHLALDTAPRSDQLLGMVTEQGWQDVTTTNSERTLGVIDSVSQSSSFAGGKQWVTLAVSPLLADRAGLNTTHETYILTLKHALGKGNATIRVSSGVAVISGKLPDGSVIAKTIPVSRDGRIPIYFDLYKHTGLLEGWIGLSGKTASGSLAWAKKGSDNSVGFSRMLRFQVKKLTR